MKSPEEVRKVLTQGWLIKAEEDFRVAEHLMKHDAPFFTAIGFHAQQATEKYLKALLVHYQLEFPKTHNLGELLDIVALRNASLADSLRDVTLLNPFGVDVRYPDDMLQSTRSDAERALALATKVRDAILPLLQG